MEMIELRRLSLVVWTLLLWCFFTEVSSFAALSSTIVANPRPTPPPAPTQPLQQKKTASSSADSSSTTATATAPTLLRTKDVVKTVAVTGATGKTGSMVVQLLLDRGVTKVVAVVRNVTKAHQVFARVVDENDNADDGRLEIVECNLADETDVAKVFSAASLVVDATIWCATGFARDESPPPPASNQTTAAPIQKTTLSSNNPFGLLWDQIMTAIGMQQEPPKATKVLSPPPPPPPLANTMPPNPGRSIDLIGLPAIAKSLKKRQEAKEEAGEASSDVSTQETIMKVGAEDDDWSPLPPPTLPKVVMCSSSGVTRPIWSDEKKQKYLAAADIPIVRLNPFSILDRKRESEQALRQSGVEYCIVRPCGLNDDWPAQSRPVFSQGDVAVGRVNRQDLARVLVDVLSIPEAVGKTFEMVTLAGYPGPLSIGPALARLSKDDCADAPRVDGGDDDDDDTSFLYATYTIMQQLLPGEKQDSAGLAMGQTYEQLDKGVTGRLGRRGTEDAEAAAPKPTS